MNKIQTNTNKTTNNSHNTNNNQSFFSKKKNDRIGFLGEKKTSSYQPFFPPKPIIQRKEDPKDSRWKAKGFLEDYKDTVEDGKLTDKDKKYFATYEKTANAYLKDWYKRKGITDAKKKLTGKMFADAARKTYIKYGSLKYVVPVELALVQGRLESSLGQAGASARKNPFNVGEYDSGTQSYVKKLDSPEKGITAYYDLMAHDYLSDKADPYDLLETKGDKKGFVNENEKRYATAPRYEMELKALIGQVRLIANGKLPKVSVGKGKKNDTDDAEFVKGLLEKAGYKNKDLGIAVTNFQKKEMFPTLTKTQKELVGGMNAGDKKSFDKKEKSGIDGVVSPRGNTIGYLYYLGGEQPNKQVEDLTSKSPAEIWSENDKNVTVVAKLLLPYLGKNDDFIYKMLNYLYLNQDDLAYFLVKPTKSSDLEKVDRKLLFKLKFALDMGWTTALEYKEMGKVDFILNRQQQATDKKTALESDKKALESAKKAPKKATPLEGSVGLKGENKPKDVKYVKDKLLELNVITQKEHGASNDILVSLIERYQRRIFNGWSDGVISKAGTTANRLMQNVRGVANMYADEIEEIRSSEKRNKENKLKKVPANKEKIKALYDSVDGDSEKLGELMSSYLRTNTKVVNAMLDYTGWLYQDNVAYYIAASTDDYTLARTDEKLLDRLYKLMYNGYTSEANYEQMARLEFFKLMPKFDFSNKELDVKEYWEKQKGPHCDVYALKVIKKHKKDNPALYKELGDIGNSKTTKANSLHTVWEENHEKGTSRKEGTKNANSTDTLEQDKGEWDMAIRYIIACVNVGVPIIVGVNHTFAYKRAAGNNDKSTDHWITIIGKGEDKDGRYFSYTDPGTKYKKVGTNTKLNRLYQDKTKNYIWRDDTKYANADSGNGSYTLVAVTLYDKHRGKSKFKVGSEIFERKNLK